MVDRSEVITSLAKARFAFQSKKSLDHAFDYLGEFDKERSDYTDEEKLQITFELFEIQYKYSTNAFLVELYKAVYGESIEISGKVPDLFPCICCGLKTMPLGITPSWDQCGYCGWIDDGTTDRLYRSHHNKNRFKNMNDCLEQAEKANDSKLKERWYS